VAEDQGPATRYRLTETIRQYGEERLGQRSETDALRAAHAEYYCELALVLGEELEGPQQIDGARFLRAEAENLRAAINHAIDTDNSDLALRLVRCLSYLTQRIISELLVPVDAVFSLSGASDHPLYPYALAAFAAKAASRGELAGMEATCEQALAAADHFDSDPDHLVDEIVASARGMAATSLGRWAEAAKHQEQAAEICRSANRLAALSSELMGAAMHYTMAGQPDRAVPLASEGLKIARRLGTPIFIAQNLAALAGALIDTDPGQARTLLEESIKLRNALGLESSTLSTPATLVAARTRDWDLTLQTAEHAIRYLHWGGDRPWLSGIFNVVARAIAQTDAAGAAMLQGAARSLTSTVISPSPVVTPSTSTVQAGSAAPAGASFITELRHETTQLLRETLGEARLAELRAQGAAMNEDHAVAYALDAIARFAQLQGQP
jgi:tetratricopeptide (TPR) repeat protein